MPEYNRRRIKMQNKKNKVNKAQMVKFLLSSFLLMSMHVWANIDHTDGNECGAFDSNGNPWYWAYNDYAAIEY